MMGGVHRVGTQALTAAIVVAVASWLLVGDPAPASAAAPKVVVANSGAPDSVTVLDPTTGSVLTVTNAALLSNPRYVAITPNGRYAGITNGGNNQVTWLDLRTTPPTFLASNTLISGGSNPQGIALTNEIGVVAVRGGNDKIVVLDLAPLDADPPAAPTVKASLPLTAGDGAEGVVISRSQEFALVALRVGKLAYVNLAVDPPVLVTATTDLGGSSTPFGVAVTPNGRLALVTLSAAGAVAVVDLSTLDVSTNTVPGSHADLVLGPVPQGVAITSDGAQAVIALQGTDQVAIMNLTTFSSVLASVGDAPFGVALCSVATTEAQPGGIFRAAVVNEGVDSVSLVDLVSPPVPSPVAAPVPTVGDAPRGIACTGVRAPVAVVSASPRTAKTTVPIAFTGTRSSDRDGTVKKYTYAFGDGVVQTKVCDLDSTCATTSHAYAQAGSFRPTLVVTDDNGAVSAAALAGLVKIVANRPPTAVFTTSPTSGRAPLTVNVIDKSKDADGTVVGYCWNFGDGPAGCHSTSKTPPAHVYSVKGTYPIQLIVTDDSGAPSAPYTRNLLVK